MDRVQKQQKQLHQGITMASRQQQRTLKTREKVLSSARFLFDSNGYENSSVDQIAEHAGVSKGTIFVHFSDKASLLTAVRIENMESIARETLERSRSPVGDDPVDAMVEILKPWLDMFAGDREFTRVFMDQASLTDPDTALRLYDACCAMETATGRMVDNLIAGQRLSDRFSANIYVQGIIAFFYHVLTGLQSGATRNSGEQEILLRALLQRWFFAG